MALLFLAFLCYPIFFFTSKIIENKEYRMVFTFILSVILTILSFSTWCSDGWISWSIWRQWACSHHWWVESNINTDWFIIGITFIVLYSLIFFLENRRKKYEQIVYENRKKELEIINMVKDRYYKLSDEIRKIIALKLFKIEQEKKKMILNAITEKIRISFNYKNNSWKESYRTIKPQSTNQKKWTVYWYCFLKNEKRYFKIRKIKNVILTDIWKKEVI